MPELSDVESFKRYFKKTSLNKKIVEIEAEAKNRRERDGKCPQNKNHQLKREIIAGRLAIYCPICQR